MRRLVGLRRRGREKRSGKGVGVAGQFDLSPAQAVLRLLDVLLDGRWRPSNADLLTIKRMLVEEEDLRKPVAYQQQLLANSDQDDEVNRAMVQLLIQRPEAPPGIVQLPLPPLEQTDPASILDSPLVDMLQTAGEWQYDLSPLVRATEGRPLAPLAFWALLRLDCVDALNLDARKLLRYLKLVADSMQADLPYHNELHVAQVVSRMFALVKYGGRRDLLEDKAVSAACILAAAIHDFGHLGVSNAYLVTTRHPLAITYSDSSPLENYHLAQAFSLMMQPEVDFMQDVPRATTDRIRDMVVQMVLATDLSKHASVMQQVQANLTRRREEGRKPMVPAPWLLRLVMKVADLAHCCTDRLEVHLDWVDRLTQENFRQGQMERERGMAVSPLMDDSGPGVKASQVPFYSVVVLPMLCALVDVFHPAAADLLDGALNNFAHWCREDKHRPADAARQASMRPGGGGTLLKRLDGDRGLVGIASDVALHCQGDRRVSRRNAYLLLRRAASSEDLQPDDHMEHCMAWFEDFKRFRQLAHDATLQVLPEADMQLAEELVGKLHLLGPR